jgi:hypothetical protein
MMAAPERGVTMPEPSPTNNRATPGNYLARLHPNGGSIEASEGQAEATREGLGPERAERARDKTRRILERERGEPLGPELVADLDQLFLTDGVAALHLIRENGDDAELNPGQADAAEAIVYTDGSRPTLAVDDEGVIVHDDEDRKALGSWGADAEGFSEAIRSVAGSVGRIDRNGVHCGTGFVVGDDLILTNRHVLQALAAEDQPGHWTFSEPATITFDADPGQYRQRSFTIEPTVVATGPEHAPKAINLAVLDYAVLRCRPGDGFPPPLLLESDPDKIFVTRPIYTISYPAKPGDGSYQPSTLERLFAHRYGRKRFAPGYINCGLGQEYGDVRAVTIGHDATTLGGSSGSCVVDFANDGHLVVGLHFAGAPHIRNWAHALASLARHLDPIDLHWRDFVE